VDFWNIFENQQSHIYSQTTKHIHKHMTCMNMVMWHFQPSSWYAIMHVGPFDFFLTGAVRSWNCQNIPNYNSWSYHETAHWPRNAPEGKVRIAGASREGTPTLSSDPRPVKYTSPPPLPLDTHIKAIYSLPSVIRQTLSVQISYVIIPLPLSLTHDVWTYNVLILSQKNYNFIKTHPT